MQSPFWTKCYHEFATFATFGSHKHYATSCRVYSRPLLRKHIYTLVYNRSSPTLVTKSLVVVVIATSPPQQASSNSVV